MRKKINVDDKNVKIGITIHPDLAKILNRLTKENKITKSKMIQNIMMDHFKNKVIYND
jgi:hypothetical protein